MSSLKPIKLWGQGGPNAPKVAIILAELNIPHETIPVLLSDVKKPDFVAINPNGRIPAIYDPNTDITLWESGAIVEYLIERYDTEHRLSFPPGTAEAAHAKQWLFFQVTGQGPYYGQVAWFKRYHHEQLPSAQERYAKEVNRVSGVLEGWLAKQKEEYAGSDGLWLVGNKMSYADIAFIMYQKIMPLLLTKEEFDEDSYPHVNEWLGNMESREVIKGVLAESMKPLK